jgi:hypothetical protein
MSCAARSTGAWCPWSPRNRALRGLEGSPDAIAGSATVESRNRATNGAHEQDRVRFLEVILNGLPGIGRTEVDSLRPDRRMRVSKPGRSSAVG